MVHQSSKPFKRPKKRYIQLELPFDEFDIVLHQMHVIWAAIVELEGIIEIQGLYNLYDTLTLKLVKMKYNSENFRCMVDSSSKTIPTKVLTPREILQRYAQGADIPAAFYESDDDPDEMDDDQKMEREIGDDDFAYRQFILETSEESEAAPALASTFSDGSGNNTNEQQQLNSEISQPSENQQPTSENNSDSQ